MKKVKSLKDLQRLMEDLGAVKEVESGFTSWTVECGPSSKLQAASALKKTQLNNRVKKEREKKT